MSQPRYHINLFWSAEDACWIADVPDLKYCTTHGSSPGEAAENADEAIRGWLETAEARGIDIPTPKYRPSIYTDQVRAA